MKRLLIGLSLLISFSTYASNLEGTYFSDSTVQAINGQEVTDLSLNSVTFKNDNTYVNKALYRGTLVFEHGTFQAGEKLTLTPNNTTCNGMDSRGFEVDYEISGDDLTYIFNYDGKEYKDIMTKTDSAMIEEFKRLSNSARVVICD
jgi:hypothetical protein